MEDFVTVRGMVIKHSCTGDYDWVATIFTADRGKITAFARGARKPAAKLSGSVEPFCFGTFKLFAGKNSYTIVEADIENYFEGFRQDLEGACYGTFFLELASYYTRENVEDKELLNLLYISLKALLNENIPNKLVKCIYEIKALQIEGEYPGVPENMELMDSTRYAIDFIVRTPLEKLYSFNVTKEVLDQLCKVADIYRNRFIDRPLKSLEMLEAF
ncbi:DNA replication and repair protein RecO [Butyrivibrio hungatei DSM 14810]|uniref:DNA repair protein RecO n=1 Tax=Butyrivibrio hungatei DSM 14810 TaxID=1121132 RepID=A0A1M7S7F3_9FIRM|nr:DNA repair protein RecO [Butyrivibrio hungatei]SHN54557.1 DNA replication and repair protein RecO [Butyrivibrio hungatei DSM 14810]